MNSSLMNTVVPLLSVTLILFGGLLGLVGAASVIRTSFRINLLLGLFCFIPFASLLIPLFNWKAFRLGFSAQMFGAVILLAGFGVLLFDAPTRRQFQESAVQSIKVQDFVAYLEKDQGLDSGRRTPKLYLASVIRQFGLVSEIVPNTKIVAPEVVEAFQGDERAEKSPSQAIEETSFAAKNPTRLLSEEEMRLRELYERLARWHDLLQKQRPSEGADVNSITLFNNSYARYDALLQEYKASLKAYRNRHLPPPAESTAKHPAPTNDVPHALKSKNQPALTQSSEDN